MSLSITLYKTADDKHVVNKTLTDNLSVDGTARGEFEVTGGSVTVETSTNLSAYNYCYISDFGRYYFVNRITALRTGLWMLDLRVDVLKTYATNIQALTGTVDRQENKYNGYLGDSNYNAMCYSQIVAKTFPNGMTADNLILMTVG